MAPPPAPGGALRESAGGERKITPAARLTDRGGYILPGKGTGVRKSPLIIKATGRGRKHRASRRTQRQRNVRPVHHLIAKPRAVLGSTDFGKCRVQEQSCSLLFLLKRVGFILFL